MSASHHRRLCVEATTAAIALAVALGLLAFPAAPAGAQSESEKQQVDQQITSARSQVQEASAAEAKLVADLDAATARKRELDAKVGAIDSELRSVQRTLDVAQAQLSAAEEAQRSAEARLGATQAALAESRRRLASYAVAAYTGQSQAAQYIQTVVRASSMDELVARRSYLKAVGNNQAEAIAANERLRDEVRDLTEQLERVRQEAVVQRDKVAVERSRLQGTRDAQAAVQREFAAEVSKIGALHNEAAARKGEFEAQVRDLAAQSAAIEASLRRRAEEQRAAAAAPQASPGAAGAAGPTGATTTSVASAPRSGGLVNPVPGAPVTSSFGYRVHPIYGDSRLHTGVDFGASEGTSIRAAGAGVVVSAGWISGYGNATIIDHGNGLATLYAHQSSMAVSTNQRVGQGEAIGRVGCTGSCTGPNLHFEVRVDGTPVNPIPYVS